MTITGEVVELLPGALAKVKLDGGETIAAHVAEEFRRETVPVKQGDRVVVRRSPMDPGRGSIVGRARS